jgi:hypothetical protein
MAKKPEPPKLFWVTYRHSDGRPAGVVVIESVALLHARLKVSLAHNDRGAWGLRPGISLTRKARARSQ